MRFLLLLLCATFSAQAQVQFSGYVNDKNSSEFLIGANVVFPDLQLGVSTNSYGYFSIEVPAGEHRVQISFIGFQTLEDTLKISQNQSKNFYLEPAVFVTEEIVLTAERQDKNVQETAMSKLEIPMAQVLELPAFMGEVDILKSIQLLPGVQSAGEGNSGFYVRGGGPDQNLILLDEAVIYNAAHLLGFFSVFNADAIKSAQLTKGGMPAKYGGRLSSVLDISMRDGNYKKHQVSGGIGLISSRLTVEGPIKKDTASYMIAARRTYLELLLNPVLKANPEFEGNSYFFYDLNTKINYRLSDRNRLFLSGYFGQDLFTYQSPDSEFGIQIPWGNATGSLRWNHVLNGGGFMNTSLVFSNYKFEFNAVQDEFEFGIFSGIRDYNLKWEIQGPKRGNHSLNYGANIIYHVFTPSNVTGKLGDTEINTGDIIRQYGIETGWFISDQWTISPRLSVDLGLRLSSFSHIGPFTRYQKNDQKELLATINYAAGEHIQSYGGLEPRFNLRYLLDETSSLKASYTENYQYVHLASISAIALPTDVWIPSSDIVEPQFGQQLAMGYFKNFKDNTYETSFEVYYKNLEGLVEFKEGAQPGADVNDNTDNNLTFGTGNSYGAELFIKKRLGKSTGWLGYTWSRTTRQFEDINDGKRFLATYDRTHDLSITFSHKLNKKWSIGSVFVFGTGKAITLPEQSYLVNGELYVEYGERNSYRIPPYHRLDISATFRPKSKKGLEQFWVFAVYNVYNRRNPYFIRFDTEGSLAEGAIRTSAKQVSLFPIIPSVTWNFKF